MLMKHFTLSLRALTLCVATLMASVAFAEPDNAYHWFYDVFEVYPTGAGQIYVVDQDEDTAESKEDIPAESWAATTEYKAEVFGQSTKYLNGYAQPAEGWHFLGFGTQEEVLSPASYYSDYTMLFVNSKTSADDNTTDLTPFEPDTTIYALFTHVYATVDASCNLFGAVDVKPFINNIGDDVTLTATPNEEYKATFDYWLAPDGETQLTDPVIKVKASEVAQYIAFFHSDAVETIPADPSGYTIIYDERNLTLISDYASVLFINTYEPEKDRLTYTIGSGYIWGQTPTIVWSYSDIVVLPMAEDVYPSDNPLWMKAATPVSDLDGSMTWFQVVLPTGDEWQIKLQKLAATVTIPEGTMVVGISNETIATLGGIDDVLTLEEYVEPNPDEDAVKSVNAAVPASEAIYDMSGRRIKAMNRKGIYVVGGKKVVIRK